MKSISSHIINRLELQDIVNVLSGELSGSELNSVLLDVFDKRIRQETLSSLLNKYQRNKLVKPAPTDVIKQKEDELNCYKISADKGFDPIELSPVSQLGTSSIMAPVDQKNVLTALRNTEVLSDPTNVIALHYASLKKKGKLDNVTCHYSNISRVIRTQLFSNPNFLHHFSVLCMVSCGKDTGNFGFEKEALLKHLTALYEICKNVYSLEQAYFEIIPWNGYDSQSPLITNAVSYVRERNSDLRVSVVEPDPGNGYYYGFRIKIKAIINGSVCEFGDGGLLDWTQKLLSNRKERMLVSSIGLELIDRLIKN